MREILFRGKRLDNGEWVYGGYHYEHGFAKVNEKHYITVYETFGAFSYNEFAEANTTTIGQFTGLFDKYSNKIFEGDIAMLGNVKTVVNYDKPMASFVLDSEDITYKLTNEKSTRLEIIGNIHDNKGLLKWVTKSC